ncbi:MAG: hypothetical protein AAGE59_13795 [Cyanobacteria bacterium P01_F01_bin.86]
MTSQQDQIQSLIADIEQVLGAGKPRKPWVKASDMETQRRALARAQDYLKSLQQTFEAPGGWGPVDPSTGEIASQSSAVSSGASVSSGDSGLFVGGAVGANDSADQVLQSLLTEMKFLRSSALEPLRLEMDSLREERDSLQTEVKSLAEQRSASLAAIQEGHVTASGGGSNAVSEAQLNDQLNEFLQVLMERLQDRLSVQVTQTLAQLESDHSDAIAKLSASTDEELLQLRPSGQIEELRQLQSRSDQLLVNIDSTLQGMFETLQKNIDSYQLSLNEGIDNMHSLGRQGEVIVRSLVDHLTQQLGQTAPPEPAFYPPRDALVQAPMALAEDPDAAPDTVSSLNEVLSEGSAAEAADVSVDSEGSVVDSASAVDLADEVIQPELSNDATTDSTVDEVVDGSAGIVASAEPAADESDASNSEELNPEELNPEDCIREDGTIDLDLLKLDIDRSDEDAGLTRDDLVVDSAIADAKVAATEADDPEIESKVMPTEDAAYLADLTLDDLTMDSDLTDAVLEDLPSVDSSAADELPSDAGANTAGGVPSLEFPLEAPLEQQSPEFTSAEDTDLAAVLPDLGGSPIDAGMGSEESVLGDSVSGASDAAVDKPESALVPDIPDVNEAHGGAANNGAAIHIDDVMPEELAASLAAASQEADQAARASDDIELAALTSDLEETVVFDGPMPEPTTLADAANPLESAFIPDRPDDGASAGGVTSESVRMEAAGVVSEMPTFLDADSGSEATAGAAEDPFEASLKDLESLLDDDDGAADLEDDPANILGDVDSPISPPLESPSLPADFDDDLDFYEGDASSPVESATASSEVASALLGNSASDDVLDELPPIVAPPLEMPLPETPLEEGAAGETTQSDLDPFVTADLDRPPAMDAILEGDDQSPDAQGYDDEGDDDPTDGEPANWFLGLDLGTTGLSAVLMNQLGDQVYPLCWNIAGDQETNRFRLPAVVQVDAQARQLGAVGPAALQQGDEYLRNLKPLLKIGIPHGVSGEPWVQWSDQVSLPLMSMQSAVSQLLKTLGGDRPSCRAVGLKNSALQRALADLKGVVVGYPNNWPDTYSFNIREAVLAAGLVERSDQVIFVDEAIAALLSALPDPAVEDEELEGQQPGLYNCNWSGGTVVLSAGSTLTETAVVDLPGDLHQLTYGDFALRSFTYAGDSLDQDIVCQLLHAPAQANLDALKESGNDPADAIADGSIAQRWESLGLDRLNLPQAGEADRIKRHRLRQRLNNSALGRQAIEAAREIKLALQEDSEFDLQLGDQIWTIKAKDLQDKVFLPYIQRMNRQVNGLLSQKGMSTQAVKQVVCTGGAASLSAIARWLRQKFPNATIIQDTYSGEYSNSCSRVAYGLANLCHYPNVLDVNRHQYNDYFLLLELLRVLPDQPLPAGGILHLLEQRGVNTKACQSHILALIEGHLPPGLVPTEGDRPMISAQSPDIATYQALAELPLFRKQGGQIYIADREQADRLRTHLESILGTKSQGLTEPLTLQLAAENV